MEREKKEGRGRKDWKGFLIVAVLFLVVAGIGSVVCRRGKFLGRNWGASEGVREPQLRLEVEKLEREIAARYVKFTNDVKRIEEDYRGRLPLVEAEAYFNLANEGAVFIASKEGLCGFKPCVVLAYKMAYDEIMKTNRTEEAIGPIVTERIVCPIQKAVEVYINWTVEFREELEKIEQEFACDLALKGRAFKENVSAFQSEEAVRVEASIGQFEAGIREHAKEMVIATISAALEGAMIQWSYAEVRKVVVKVASVALASVVKKVVTTASSAAISAAADGPLPIGDVVAALITVGGLTWTAVDIYKVTKAMPDEMRNEIRTSIEEAKKRLIDEANKNITAAVVDCLESADARVKELYQIIQ